MSLALRKRVNLTYSIFDKAKSRYSDPSSLGIKLTQCQCDTVPNPRCSNIRNWTIDWRQDKPVFRRLCPRAVKDKELWESVYFVLYELKELGNAASFFGLPVAHLGEPVYQVIERAFAARARYQAQRDFMER